MKTSFALCFVLLSGLVGAQAETTAQKLKYIKDITGVACSADHLTVYASPNRAASGNIDSAFVVVERGQLDARGDSWLYVSDNKTKRALGWVKLMALSCI
jgi:hypothetical protein